MTAETRTVASPATRPRRGGRPPLTESRKAQVRLDIAKAAVRLFTEQGLDGTSVAQIAEAAGISTRTLWRYFASKEECAAPLLSYGLDRFTAYVRAWPADLPLVGAADSVDWFTDDSATRLLLVIDLLRLACTEPALDAVWSRCFSEGVGAMGLVLAERFGCEPTELRIKVKASMLLAATHQAMRDYISRVPGEHGLSLEDTIREATRIGLAAIDG